MHNIYMCVCICFHIMDMWSSIDFAIGGSTQKVDDVLQGIHSGIAYYVMGVVIKAKGPVFYSAFNPLSTVIIAISSSIVMAEELYLGR